MLFTVRIDATVPPPNGRRRRRRCSRRPTHLHWFDAATRAARMSASAHDPWPYPLWIAHRGAGKLAPENTLAAFRFGRGTRLSRVRVRRQAAAPTAYPSCCTTPRCERTTLERGAAGDTDMGRAVPAGCRRLAQPRLRRRAAGELESIARYCLHNGFALNIEIKPTPGAERETGRVVARRSGPALGRRAGAAVAQLVSSRRARSAHAGRPALPRALLLDALARGWFEEARALGCVAVVPHYALMDARLVAQLHAAGMRALVYTVNDPAEAQPADARSASTASSPTRSIVSHRIASGSSDASS